MFRAKNLVRFMLLPTIKNVFVKAQLVELVHQSGVTLSTNTEEHGPDRLEKINDGDLRTFFR